MSMFCYQCEQAAKGTGCDRVGVCGKNPGIADLQDVLIYQAKGIGYFAHEARKLGAVDSELDRFAIEALFTTVTNVNFDKDRLMVWIEKGRSLRQRAEELLCRTYNEKQVGLNKKDWPAAATYTPGGTAAEIAQDAERVPGIRPNSETVNEDVRSLRHILLYGLKGMAAYADHAFILGKEDDAVYAFVHEALSALTDDSLDVSDLVELNLRCGATNIRTMEILDEANTSTYGHPVPTTVSTALREGPAIIVTGHDLLDLEELLRQTEGTGVNIYTHGEMLPAHGYPGLKKYPHLAGHFGTAWQNQRKEFDNLPAAILFTTNCIQEPQESYRANVFTTGLVAWPGVLHVANRDFTPVIAKAKALGGFKKTEGKKLMTGFARNAVLGVADKVVDAVKAGKIKHFMLVGGCDGAKPGRNYYTELVEKAPADTVILTLACGKFRFNHLELGAIDGIPRLLDIGQCNDAYSAVKIAQALAAAFNCGVNDLPLSLVLSWYEQKAVAILLSLFSLGIKGIRLGPSLPAFVSPNVLKVLVDTFDVKPIGTVEEDLEAMTAPALD